MFLAPEKREGEPCQVEERYNKLIGKNIYNILGSDLNLELHETVGRLSVWNYIKIRFLKKKIRWYFEYLRSN